MAIPRYVEKLHFVLCYQIRIKFAQLLFVIWEADNATTSFTPTNLIRHAPKASSIRFLDQVSRFVWPYFFKRDFSCLIWQDSWINLRWNKNGASITSLFSSYRNRERETLQFFSDPFYTRWKNLDRIHSISFRLASTPMRKFRVGKSLKWKQAKWEFPASRVHQPPPSVSFELLS